MYYLYGENVIIDVREDPRMGSVGPGYDLFQNPPTGGAKDVRVDQKFPFRT